jgi:hypothetical protein
VAFIEVAMTAKMQQIELIDQAMVLQEFESAIDGDASDIGINLLREIKYFSGVQVLRSALHYL